MSSPEGVIVGESELVETTSLVCSTPQGVIGQCINRLFAMRSRKRQQWVVGSFVEADYIRVELYLSSRQE